MGKRKDKGREDQCKTHIVHQRVKTNIRHDSRLQREAVFTPGGLKGWLHQNSDYFLVFREPFSHKDDAKELLLSNEFLVFNSTDWGGDIISFCPELFT